MLKILYFSDKKKRVKGAGKLYSEGKKEAVGGVETTATFGAGYAEFMGWQGMMQQMTPKIQQQMPMPQQGGMTQPMAMPYGYCVPTQYGSQAGYGAEGWRPAMAMGAAGGSGGGQGQSRLQFNSDN